MFVDSVDIFVSSGNGGPGAVSFRREKFVIHGGPDGGDGGDGGDVYFEVSLNSDTLSKFRGRKYYSANNGAGGEGRNKSGKRGSDLIIKIPLGTQIIDFDTNEILLDFDTPSKKLFLKGGLGGLGNSRFKNSINQKPTYAQAGIKGKKTHIRLELKLIADVGLIGYPNVGKSTILSVISNAKPNIANYEFTTLIPSLGVVSINDIDSFVVADIPGIINGASIGKGLGLEFLKHIERTKLFLFVLTIERSLIEQLNSLIEEIKYFNSGLLNRKFAIVITKIDLIEDYKPNKYVDDLHFCLKQNKDGFSTLPAFILSVSSVSNININELKLLLFKSIARQDM